MSRQTPVKATHGFHIDRRKLINLAIFLILLYVIVPQFSKFRSSFKYIQHINITWLLVAIGLTIATYFAAAAVYFILAKKPLKYMRTVLVQIAGMFVNRLLPAGTGAIGVNYEYLKKCRHSSAEAGAVVAVNNASGLVGHLTLLVVTLLVTRTSINSFALPHIPVYVYWIVLVVVTIALFVGIRLDKLRQRLLHSAKDIVRKIGGYGRHPQQLIGAWILSMCLTVVYILCLWSCTAAVGVHISFVQCLIVLTLGVAGGTIAPTPGGLVGAEAGLVAGLVLCHVPSAEALAVALTYRLLTYWLPLVTGPIAFGITERQHYI